MTETDELTDEQLLAREAKMIEANRHVLTAPPEHGCPHDEAIAIVVKRGRNGQTTSWECEACGTPLWPHVVVPHIRIDTMGEVADVLSSTLTDLLAATGMGHKVQMLLEDGRDAAEIIHREIIPAMRKLTLDGAKASRCSPCHDAFEHPYKDEVHMHPDGVFYLPYDGQGDLVDLDAMVDAGG